MNLSLPSLSKVLLRGTLLLLVLAGCGRGSDSPPLGQVSGQVMLEGKPVSNGSVNFMNDTGFGLSAPLDSAGSYVLQSQYGSGIPIGTYQVTVSPPPPPANDSGDASNGVVATPVSEIPKKYREFSTSGFKFQVEQGSQTFDLDLTQ